MQCNVSWVSTSTQVFLRSGTPPRSPREMIPAIKTNHHENIIILIKYYVLCAMLSNHAVCPLLHTLTNPVRGMREVRLSGCSDQPNDNTRRKQKDKPSQVEGDAFQSNFRLEPFVDVSFEFFTRVARVSLNSDLSQSLTPVCKIRSW